MPGQPFRSCLNPFIEYITQARLERKTWHEIAEYINAQGTKTDTSQVARFAKRHAAAKLPFGFPPKSAPVGGPPAESVPPAESQPTTEPVSYEDDFRPPPLNLFPSKKKHS